MIKRAKSDQEGVDIAEAMSLFSGFFYGMELLMKNIKKLVWAAVFLALGLILPFFTGQIPEIGNKLLPMHIPVLICGFVCGWKSV